MKRVEQILMIVSACIALPATAMAATHEVTVSDDFFSPNDLTITAGDTVRWVNPAGGMPHDVDADDGSFSSTTASAFTFEHTFGSAGEVLYFCSVHSSAGKDRNSFMNGRIVVQAGTPPVQINAGMNDTWRNVDTRGQGFFVTVFPDIQKMFVGWFTYDVARPPADVTAILGDPGARWLTAFGPYSGDTATLDIELTQGGIFDSGVPAPTQGPDGTMTVKFTSCSEGVVTYNIPSVPVSGTIPITRVANDNVPVCEALQP